MKAILKPLSIIILIMALAGCAAQKTAKSSTESETLHMQALKALNEQKFIIKINEFYLSSNKSANRSPDNSPVKSATNSHISMQGSRAIIKFAPDLSPRPPFNFENIEDNAAEITKEKSKKNGDEQYSIIIKGEQNSQNRKILITLYKNTNKCFGHVTNEILSYHVVDFTGEIYPLEEDM